MQHAQFLNVLLTDIQQTLSNLRFKPKRLTLLCQNYSVWDLTGNLFDSVHRNRWFSPLGLRYEVSRGAHNVLRAIE